MSALTDPLDPDCASAPSDPTVFGGVEAGGTKWVCAKGLGPGDLAEVEVIPTTTPPQTLSRVVEPAEQLDDQAAGALEARYLAIGIMNVVLTVSPERVVLGGGVVKKPALLPLVRAQVKELMSGYIELARDVGSMDNFIVPSALGDHPGVLGALHLAMAAHPGLAK